MNDLEIKILRVLYSSEPLGSDELISKVREINTKEFISAVDIKIAALSMVSKGNIKLNDNWQFHIGD